jgi:hypothetical protein
VAHPSIRICFDLILRVPHSLLFAFLAKGAQRVPRRYPYEACANLDFNSVVKANDDELHNKVARPERFELPTLWFEA